MISSSVPPVPMIWLDLALQMPPESCFLPPLRPDTRMGSCSEFLFRLSAPLSVVQLPSLHTSHCAVPSWRSPLLCTFADYDASPQHLDAFGYIPHMSPRRRPFLPVNGVSSSTQPSITARAPRPLKGIGFLRRRRHGARGICFQVIIPCQRTVPFQFKHPNLSVYPSIYLPTGEKMSNHCSGKARTKIAAYLSSSSALLLQAPGSVCPSPAVHWVS